MTSIYDFEVIKQNGEVESLKKYEGKTLLIMNSATHSRFTAQYPSIDILYNEFKDRDLFIFDFPSNDFGNTPEDDSEITQFLEDMYEVSFPQYKKVNVKGNNQSPLFKFLEENTKFNGFNEKHPTYNYLVEECQKEDNDFMNNSKIKSDFTKFLVNPKGEIVRIEATAFMDSLKYEIIKAVENNKLNFGE